MIPDLVEAISGVDPDDVKAACGQVRLYCGWHIAPSVTETVILDGPGSELLTLNSLHITAVSSVINNGTQVEDPDWSAAGFIRGCWTSRLRGVEVTFTHGHEDCPAEIRAAVKRLAQYGSRPVGLVSAGTGPFSASFGNVPLDEAGMDPYVAGVLDRYRIPPRP